MPHNNSQELTGGHLFMIGLPGTELDESTLQLINEHSVHNFIIFRRNVKNKPQLQTLCAALNEACQQRGLPRPLISIDQEGGPVARLPRPFTQFPAMHKLSGAPNHKKLLAEYAATCARELREVGINMNLAPVLDICPADQDLFMEERSLGGDARQVTELGHLLITGLQGAGVAACAKHFPGLGAATLDPHKELPEVDLPLSYFKEEGLAPFRLAAAIGAAAFMTSHAVYNAIAPQVPGTLSPKVVGELIRDECGYEGLIITDDLEMGAIELFMPFPQAVLRALLAGADLLLICHDHDKVRAALHELTRAEKSGEISTEIIRDSLYRQQALLRRFGRGL